MVELLKSLWIDLGIALLQTLKHARKLNPIPKVRCAEKKQEASEREEELKVLFGKEIAEERSKARDGRAILGLGGRFHYHRG
jgi:hypothetical protein